MSGGVFPSAFDDGLTKRELFAAMALQGFASGSPAAFDTMQDAVETSVKWADLLLAQLSGDDTAEIPTDLNTDTPAPIAPERDMAAEAREANLRG